MNKLSWGAQAAWYAHIMFSLVHQGTKSWASIHASSQHSCAPIMYQSAMPGAGLQRGARQSLQMPSNCWLAHLPVPWVCWGYVTSLGQWLVNGSDTCQDRNSLSCPCHDNSRSSLSKFRLPNDFDNENLHQAGVGSRLSPQDLGCSLLRHMPASMD